LFLVLYAGYCFGMAFNKQLEAIVKAKLPVPDSWNVSQPLSGDTKDPEGGYGQMDAKGNINGHSQGNAMEMTTKSTDGMTNIPMSPPNPEQRAPVPNVQAVEPLEDPLEKPMDGDRFKLAKWALLYPLYFISKWTIPDCRKEQMSRYFVATFCLSVLWISLYSYMMVWMITVIGFTLAIPDTVMGLTFIAAGVSVPDALSGIAVVKEGKQSAKVFRI
jgi:sodium/potassium/calcium exchanger 4